MQYFLIFLFVVTSACSSSTRKPAADVTHFEIPNDAMTLDQALSQGPDATLEYLKERITAQSYASIATREPGSDLPDSIRAMKMVPDRSRAELRTYLRKFRNLSFEKKRKKAQDLIANFQCAQVAEPQAMGLSLERNFPNDEAYSLSQSLHEKVIGCGDDHAKQESILRLAVFSIQKSQCDQALGYLKQFPGAAEQGMNDRVSYLQSLCAPDTLVENRNPWGGYGIQLGAVQILTPEKPLWYLTTASGNPEWDRLLSSYVELVEKKEYSKLKHVAHLLDYEKFRSLPPSFQASMMVLMNYAGADLAVFQTLHRFLAERPQLMTKEVAGLLFPVRYWKEILANSTGTDPILVKALIRQESAFNPSAKSPAKAYGLMQLIYPTARLFGVKQKKQLMVPEVNIRAGSVFLGKLIHDFGSVELALAAYNAGPLTVREWQQRYPTENIDLFVEMIPYSETREYVRLVSRNYKIYQNLLLEKPNQKADLAKK